MGLEEGIMGANEDLKSAPCCFVVSSFSQQMDDVFDAVEGVANDLGYRCHRCDTSYHGAEITSVIHDSIRGAKFVVADLSEPKPNVYYEVGFARGLGKPTILIRRESPTDEFDLRNVQQIVYRTFRELKQELHRAISGSLGRAEEICPAIESCGECIPASIHNVSGEHSVGDLLTMYAAQVEVATDNRLKGMALLNRSRVYCSLQLVEQSIEDLEAAKLLIPDHAEVYVDLGYVYNKAKRFDEAIRVLKKAQELNPDAVSSYMHEAFALNGLQKYGEAIEAARKALAIDPSSRAAQRLMAYASEQQTEPMADDEPAPVVATTDDISEDSAIIAAQMYIRRGQYQLALSILTNALQKTGSSDRLHREKGRVLKLLGRLDEAADQLKQAIQYGSDYWENYYEYGCIFLAGKRFDEAVDPFERALSLKPDNVDALAHIGFVLGRNDRQESALAAYNDILEREPDHSGTLMNRGYLYNKLNRREEALADYEKATTIDPSNAEAWAQKGYTLVGLGKLDEALRSTQKSLEIKPGNMQGTKVLSTILRLQGRPAPKDG